MYKKQVRLINDNENEAENENWITQVRHEYTQAQSWT